MDLTLSDAPLTRRSRAEFAQSVIALRQLTAAPEWAIAERALLAETSEAVAISRACDVDDARYREFVLRFADFYTGRDLIKSIHNGSRREELTAATEMDWGGSIVFRRPVSSSGEQELVVHRACGII